MKNTSEHARILVVDDERNMHYSFKKILPSPFEVLSAHNAEEGIAALKRCQPDVVVMDIKMEGMSGLNALKLMRKIDQRIPIIMVTAYGTVGTAIRAMKYGAYEYMLKPFDVERMRTTVGRAVEASRIMQRSVRYDFEAHPRDDDSDQIVGASEPMQEVYKLIGQVAPQQVTALILGESGTGKELVARAIYHHSKRRDKPFLCLNCAALPETLLESELFGYEKGAFTGATERRIGKFEQVNGGTLFLDEIGELSLATQAKLLRVLQSGEITRLGGNDVIHTDVRVIAATNRDLKQAIQTGAVRQDLYYRLNIIPIYLPPLRERKEDIPQLVQYFLGSQTSGFERPAIDEEALKKLVAHPWPGNVRQLENCIRRAAVLAKGGIITEENIDLESLAGTETIQAQTQADDIEAMLDKLVAAGGDMPLLPRVESLLIRKALAKCGGNQVQAARLLGINRNTLRNRMVKYAIEK